MVVSLSLVVSGLYIMVLSKRLNYSQKETIEALTERNKYQQSAMYCLDMVVSSQAVAQLLLDHVKDIKLSQPEKDSLTSLVAHHRIILNKLKTNK
jgi:hypothetical protein